MTDIGKARSWYKLTDQSTNTDFPLANKIPWLEQNLTAIKYLYALDPFESRYFMLVSAWRKILESIAPKLFAAFSKFKYTTNQEFATLYWAWQSAIKVCFSFSFIYTSKVYYWQRNTLGTCIKRIRFIFIFFIFE